MIDNGKKLNLKWVSETIGDSYKKWNKGEVVLLNAQTGTGKTYFIQNKLLNYIKDYEQILFVCNRTNLKRQFKKDLLTKYGLEIPETIEELDKITKIENIVITSYHAIQDSVLDRNYNLTKFNNDLNNYDYIILDEAHYILADGGFNNKTRIAIDTLIKDYHRHSVKIFISATMEEIKKPISNYLKSLLGKTPKIHDYTTGIDYSYVNTTYFKYLDSIIATIKNDTLNDKWLVFVSSFNDADKIKEELGDICTIIKSGTKNNDLLSIVNNSKFECKVLIATKTLDNGINLKDEQLKNIVIMAWDKITFIQMLGRKRIDIDNAQQVNLYINTRYKKSFLQKLFRYNKKLKEVELYQKNENEFNRKYDNDLKKLGKNLNELFYIGINGGFKLNMGGYFRLIKDIKFSAYMVNKFKTEGEFAFITEQLSWLELEHTFDKSNLIEDVMLDEDIEKLEDYLDSIVGKVMLQANDRMELIKKINLIDTHNSNIKEGKIKLLKNKDTLNSYLREINLDYNIKEFETSQMINGKKKNFKSAWKVMRLSDK